MMKDIDKVMRDLAELARKKQENIGGGRLEQHGGNNWTFFGKSCDDESKTHKVRLLLANSMPIQRHIKIKSAANPYDPAHETYFEKREGDHMAETFRGGGIISPALGNCGLNGLERLLKKEYPTGTRLKSVGDEKPCVNLIRYADDFVITGRTKELLEEGVKPLVEHFLQERGLELSSTKTVITHVTNGFDFLGQNA